MAAVARSQASTLKGYNSEVQLHIKEGCPKRAYLMEVRTDLSNFGAIIPDDECFISPVVEVLAPAETRTSHYILKIPHCLDRNNDKTKVKVRLIHENRNPAVVEVPIGDAGALYYDIDDRFIELHTTHFCKVICTICQTPYHCLNREICFFFAKFETHKQKVNLAQRFFTFLKKKNRSQHDIEIRPYFCGVIHDLIDFRQVKLFNAFLKKVLFCRYQICVL